MTIAIRKRMTKNMISLGRDSQVYCHVAAMFFVYYSQRFLCKLLIEPIHFIKNLFQEEKMENKSVDEFRLPLKVAALFYMTVGILSSMPTFFAFCSPSSKFTRAFAIVWGIFSFAMIFSLGLPILTQVIIFSYREHQRKKMLPSTKEINDDIDSILKK